MSWISKPNKWYDKLKEPQRFLLFLGIVIILLIGGDLIFDHLGILLVGFFGLYRVSYFLIEDYKRKDKMEKNDNS